MKPTETTLNTCNARRNRLGDEKSPYLLQHANNPVDWFPWGEAAFETALAEDKPVFLSVGYATCHWCHVMAHESFEDEETAALLNDAFVCVKVDREERPDIDHTYMEVCQIMTGGGGWPLTVLLTPDKEPFFAATYIPKRERYGRRGLSDLIPEVQMLWRTDRERLLTSAATITRELRSARPLGGAELPDISAMHLAFSQLENSFDWVNGGFGTGMKFPTPHQLSFLLRYDARFSNERARAMVEKTLSAMRNGGIFDQVGFGFHRYATDPEWKIPHFEKMLYDQALLLIVYTEAFQATGNDDYRETAILIAEYVLWNITAKDGGFFSAEDADSEGEEGKFYLWEQHELDAILGAEDASLVSSMFNTKVSGNFSDSEEGRLGRNILHRTELLSDTAARLGISMETLLCRWSDARKKLLNARAKRIPPLKDDKILTDWNGLMTAAFSLSGRVFSRPDHIAAALGALDFIESRLTDAEGRLMHRYREGEAKGLGALDDYAFFAWGLIELYQSTSDASILKRSAAIAELMLSHFSDATGGALFFTADDAEVVLTRFKKRYDGATPSGNSIAYMVLTRLYRLTGNDKWKRAADDIARAYSADINNRPMMYTQFLIGLDEATPLACIGPECG